jgi:hypothetical protein
MATIFGTRLPRQARQLDRSHRARPSCLPAYFKNAFLKQYEKFSTFLRIEGAAFVYTDRDTGRSTAILGYPTDLLAQQE